MSLFYYIAVVDSLPLDGSLVISMRGKPLKSISCSVQAFNEDGTNASAALIEELKALGATVHDSYVNI